MAPLSGNTHLPGSPHAACKHARLPLRASMLVLIMVLGMSSGLVRGQSANLTGFDFLRLYPSARSAGMNHAAASFQNVDGARFLYNPALMGSGSLHRMATISYVDLLTDLKAGTVTYVEHLPQLGSFGGAVRHLRYGTFDRRNDEGNRTGTFQTSDLALSIAGSRTYNRNWHVGAAAHLALSTIDRDRAVASLFDVGGAYRDTSHQITISGTLKNVGYVLDRIGNSETPLPTDLRVSFSKHLEHVPVLVTLTGYNLQRILRVHPDIGVHPILQHVTVGGGVFIGSHVTFTAGYNPLEHEMLKTGDGLDSAGITVGFRLAVDRYHLDYAYHSWSGLGGVHLFTMQGSLPQ